jgi:NTP pyrophosphatase (non-canonical NTP hydrolase)
MNVNKETSEILNITLEECAEVTQAISKIFRFGFDSRYPSLESKDNKAHLEEEIGDLLCMIKILEEKGIIDENVVAAAMYNKREKLAKWSNIQL